MWDLFLRALKNPSDYLGALKNNQLLFSHQVDEGNNTYSFFFKTKHPLSWRAGRHAVFTFPDQKIEGKTWRAFSIASSALEQEIKISTIISSEPSDFKAKLKALKTGDKMLMHGPFGEFYLKPSMKQAVFIAGGIGITPFRAILYEVASGLFPDTKIDLIYAGKNDFFAFYDEIKNLAEHPNIRVTFVNTPDEVNKNINNAITNFGNQADYFISGSPGMIGAIKNTLVEQGIESIISDPFKGY